MKKHTFGIASSALSGVLLAVLFACNAPTNNIQPNSVDNNISVNQNIKTTKYSLTGAIQVARTGFNVKANFADLVSGASVTLLDGNTAVGSPVSTNASGNFTFTPNSTFTPVVGHIYTLEATKRAGVNATESPLLSLRTFLRWNGSSYNSITTGGIYLNSYTTALTIMADHDGLTKEDTIGKIAVSNGTSTPSAIGSTSVADINAVTRLVQQAINLQADPVAKITYNGEDDYSINLSAMNQLSNGGNGKQMDRLALPSLNIVINGYNGFTKATYDSLSMNKAMRDAAKDTFNAASPANDVADYRPFWTVAINAVFPDNSKPNGSFTAAQLAEAFTPDVQTIDMSKPTSFATNNGNILNGRKLSDDVVDFELQALSGDSTATDGVNSNDRAFKNTFPYLADPQTVNN